MEYMRHVPWSLAPVTYLSYRTLRLCCLMDWLIRFDPDPQWYVWTLHIITIISTPLYIVGMICILRVSLTTNGSTYQYLLATNTTMSYITQLSMSVGTIPIFALPGAGGYPLGLLYKLGVPTCFQTALVINLLAANGLVTVMLFHYRCHAVIPFQRSMNIFLIIFFSTAAIAVPTALNTAICQTLDTNRTRDEFQHECPDIFAQLPSHAIHGALLILELNSLLQGTVYFYLYLLVAAIVFIAIFIYRITVILRRQIFSDMAVQMHRTLVRCLLIQTAVYYSLYIIPAIALICIIFGKTVLASATNLAFLVVSLSDPAGALAMILAHKKYRSAVLKLFRKDKPISVHVSIASTKKVAKLRTNDVPVS